MSDAEQRIECRGHGTTAATFLCGHLSSGAAVGYHAAEEDDDPWPDAWCDACHARFLAAGGEWTDESEAGLDLKVICTHCYEAARERNRKVPPELVGKLAPLPASESRRYIHAAVHRLEQRQQTAARAGFDLASAHRWDYSAEARLLTLTRVDGSRFQADTRIAGSFSKNTSTWLWGWANGNLSRVDFGDVGRLQTFGKIRGIEQLVDPHWSASGLSRANGPSVFLLSAFRPTGRELKWVVALGPPQTGASCRGSGPAMPKRRQAARPG